MRVNYNETLSNYVQYPAGILQQNIRTMYLATRTISNPYQNNTMLQVQNLSISYIFMNYLVDLYQLSNGTSYNKTLMSLSFWGQFTDLRIIQMMLPAISSTIKNLNNSILIFIVIFSLLAPLLVIPLCVILRKRARKHI